MDRPCWRNLDKVFTSRRLSTPFEFVRKFPEACVIPLILYQLPWLPLLGQPEPIAATVTLPTENNVGSLPVLYCQPWIRFKWLISATKLGEQVWAHQCLILYASYSAPLRQHVDAQDLPLELMGLLGWRYLISPNHLSARCVGKWKTEKISC